MRSFVPAALASLAVLLAAPPAATAQDTAPADSPTVQLPAKPIPYTVLHPRKPKPKPKPKPPAVAAAPAKPVATPQAAPPPVPAVAAPVAAVVASPSPPAPPPHPTAAAPPRVAGAVPLAAGARSVAGARLAAGQPIPPAELEAFVDGVIDQAMAREHVAGAAVAVVQNGQVLLKKGYGFASLDRRRAVGPDRTLFRLGSISKTFTWIALMKEVEAGRIRLDQPVNTYLPARVQVRDQGYDQPVRVANLLDHSAGFEDRALGQLFERDFEHVRPLELYLRQERPRRVRPPGAESAYSNYGAALAGEAVAWVGGKTFERQVEDEILVPLGLSHTTFREARPAKAGLPAPMPAELAGDLSDGFRWTPAGLARRDYEYIGQIAPAGAASSTASDMARYMLALLGGGQLNGVSIYGPRTAQAFQTQLRQAPPGVNGWANGFAVYALPGGRRGYGHAGATLSFMSNLVIVPELNLGVFVSANTETARALAERLPGAVVGEFYAPPASPPRAGSPDLARQARVFAGDYLTNRRAYAGLEAFVDRLIGRTVVSITPGGRLVTRDAEGVRVWVPDGAPDAGRFIAERGDERLAFDMAGGRAQALRFADGLQRFERVPAWRTSAALVLMAALAAAAAVATLVGVPLRNRREFRENQTQSRASLIQNIQAGLWLAAIALFSLWAVRSVDLARVMYGWPGPLVVTASACALVAAALTVATLVALPAVWRGGRRVDSWSAGRKLLFSLTVLIYAAFSVMLGGWGALSPWSG